MRLDLAGRDVALDQLIRIERLRGDVATYTGTPPTVDEIALATITPSWSDLDDDTDWDALYPDGE